jgi:hypothetical protein
MYFKSLIVYLSVNNIWGNVYIHLTPIFNFWKGYFSKMRGNSNNFKLTILSIIIEIEYR